jgi:hypothetical protein
LRHVNSENSWLNPKRAVATYAIIFSMFIVWASARTAFHPGPHGIAIRYLAGIEIAGALLFIWRKTRPLGLPILLMVFAIAAGIEAYLHEWPVRFVFYAASALLVQYLSARQGLSS